MCTYDDDDKEEKEGRIHVCRSVLCAHTLTRSAQFLFLFLMHTSVCDFARTEYEPSSSMFIAHTWALFVPYSAFVSCAHRVVYLVFSHCRTVPAMMFLRSVPLCRFLLFFISKNDHLDIFTYGYMYSRCMLSNIAAYNVVCVIWIWV